MHSFLVFVYTLGTGEGKRKQDRKRIRTRMKKPSPTLTVGMESTKKMLVYLTTDQKKENVYCC